MLAPNRVRLAPKIWDFLRSVSVHFGSQSQNELKRIFKNPRFVPFGISLTKFGAKLTSLVGFIPAVNEEKLTSHCAVQVWFWLASPSTPKIVYRGRTVGCVFSD